MIYKEGGLGLNGLNRGLTSTLGILYRFDKKIKQKSYKFNSLGRHGIWNLIYFGFYHNIKVYIPKPKTKLEDYTYRYFIFY